MVMPDGLLPLRTDRAEKNKRMRQARSSSTKLQVIDSDMTVAGVFPSTIRPACLTKEEEEEGREER